MDDFVFKAENQFSQKGRSRLCEIAKGVFILAFLVFITVCGAQAWAFEYTWTGSAGDGNWETDGNWTSSDGGTTYPQAGDTAVFNTAGPFSFTENITVGNLNSNAALEFSGTVEIGAYSGSGNITNNGVLRINSASNVTIPTITNSGTIENAGGGTLTITTLTMTADTTVTNSDGTTKIGTLGGAFKATLNNSASGNPISVNGYGTTGVPTIIADAGTINLAAGTIDTLTVNNSTVIVQGALKTTGNLTLTATNHSVLQSSGDGTASLEIGGDLTINGAIGYSTGDNKKFGSVTVTGTTTINTEDTAHTPCLKTTGAVTLNTLVNNGSMEVGGALTVNGTATNNTAGKITVSGNQTYKDEITNAGTINVNAGTTFTAEKNTINSGTISVIADITSPTSAPAAATIKFDGNFTNSGTYEALGSTITFGGNVDNTGGTFTDDDAIITATGASATINGGTTGIKAASFTYGESGNVTFSGTNEYGDFTINDGSVTLGADAVTVTVTGTGTLTNKGTIVYSGAGRIVDDATPTPDPINDAGNNGTVQYTGGSAIEEFAGTGYYNLVVDAGLTLTGTGDIAVAGTAEINGAITGIDSFSVTGTSEINANITTTNNQTYTSAVTIGDGVALEGTSAQITFNDAVTINGTASFTADNITVTGDLEITDGTTTFAATTKAEAKDIKITGNAVTLAGGTTGIKADKLTYTPATPSGASLTISGNNTFGEFTATSVGGATLNVNGTQTINTKLALTGTNDTDVLTVTGSSGKFVISAEQSGRYLKIFYGNVAMNNATGVSPAVYFVATDSVYNNGTTGVQDRWHILSNKIIWTGASATNPTDWHDPANWDAGTVPGLSQAENAAIAGSFAVDTTSCDVEIPDVSPVTDYPNASAHAYTIRTLKISDAAASLELSSANNITITDTTTPLENKGTIIYSGEGRLTDGTNPINDDSQGTVQYSTGASTLSGVDYYDLVIDGGLNLTSNDDIEIKHSMVVGTAATPAAAELTFVGDLAIASGASYTANTSKLTFEKNFTNNGTFTDAAAEIIATGTAATIAGGTNGIKAASFTYTPTTSSGAKLEITGDNKFTDFTADGVGGAEITIEDEQNITGDLILTGTSKATHLNIKGNGNIVIAAEQGNGKYLTVDQSDIKINGGSGTVYYYATDSVFDTALASGKNYGIHNNWNLINEGTVFIWTGGANDQDWNNPENWDANMIPGLAAGITGGPIVDTRYYDIVIPNEYPTGTALGTNYPVIDATFTDDYIVQKLKIESDASVQLNSANNIVLFKDPFSTLGTFELENLGTIIYSAAGRIGTGKDDDLDPDTPPIFDVPTNDVKVAHNGTVEYRGSVTLTDFDTLTGDDYYNLVIDASAIVTEATASNIVIAGKFTIKASATVSAEKIGIKGDVIETGTATINGDIYFCGATPTTEIKFGDGTGSYTINGNLHLTSGAEKTLGSPITATNIILYEGTVNVNAALKTTGDLILFGNNYHITDNLDSVAAANSGASDLFKYHHAGRGNGTHAQPSYIFDSASSQNFPSSRPDGEPINSESTSCTGKMEVADTITITVGKNFYANGTSITSATGTSWTLAIPNNDNQKIAFAELYKSTIENCTVTGGVVAAVEGNTVTDCENIETLRPLIAQAYTVYDDVIYISFGYDKDNDGKVDLNPDGTPTYPAKIENTNNEINAAIAKGAESISHGNSGNVAFEGAFKDPTCQTSTNGQGDLSSFYIKADAANKWNTDATGVWHGTDDSTDRGGTHRTAVPYINLRKAHEDATDYIYETLRDSHKNRIAQYYTAAPIESGSLATPAAPANTVIGMSSDSGKAYTMVEDHASPVLIAAFTGQEQHTLSDNPALDQKDYDAHNFIEFRYSEPLLFEDTEATLNDIFDGTATPPNYTNIRADATWGHVSGTSGLAVAGIATIGGGSISAGLRPDYDDGLSPHALYIDFPVESATDTTSTINVENKETKCRVRVSIAGYVDGNIEVDGSSHKVFVRKDNKKWIGYINSAGTTMPSGTVTPVDSCRIKDRAVTAGSTNTSATLLKNAFDKNGAANHAIATVTMNAKVDTTTGLYKTWDLTPPAFAPLRINGKPWRSSYNSTEDSSEVIGFGAGTYLQVLEIHMFDNQPSYASTETPQWFSRVGWAIPPYDNNVSLIQSDTADIIGGSRPMIDKPDAEPYKTRGGIRSCTLVGEYSNFKYTTTIGSTSDSFTNASSGASSNFFTSIVSEGRTKAIEYYDSNYFNITLGDDRLTADAMFTVTFDSNSSYITDLAGNRFKPQGTITLKGLDRTPPSFSLTAVPLGTNKMLIIFADAVNLGNMQLYKNATDGDSVPALEYIPKGLKLTTSTSNIEIDDTVPAQVIFQNGKSTGIVITLKQDAVLKDITEDVYVEVVASAEYTYDPLTGTNGEVTYIQDSEGNFIKNKTQHALSDFAINAVQMQYAYSVVDPEADGEDFRFDVHAMNQSSFSAREWDEEKLVTTSVKVGKEIIMQAALYDGTSDNTGGIDGKKFIVHFDHAPDPVSVSTTFNSLTDKNWRVWLPELFKSIAPNPNTPELRVPTDGGDITYSADAVGADPADRRFMTMDIGQTYAEALWHDGDQVKFLFELQGCTVKHGGSSDTAVPLYCLRLKNPADITSLDLWSIRTRSAILQRGGVTILNNVINVNASEKATVQINKPTTKDIKVMVMTLDGNIVRYLQPYEFAEGIHYYVWDGKNKGGTPVARGLYFVRVIGQGIDETRKVMVVKD